MAPWPGPQKTGVPDQWWRFITGMFIQSGAIQLVTLLIVMLRLGLNMDRDVGSLRLLVVVFVSAVAGFGMAMLFSNLDSMHLGGVGWGGGGVGVGAGR